MKTVLVTGGCGLIGQHVCSGLLKRDCTVIAADKEPGEYNDGKAGYTFIQVDPTDKKAYAEIFANHDFDTVIHLACTVDNDFGPIITDKEVMQSKLCDKFMYAYAVDAGVKEFVMISTSQVYELLKSREPIREDDLLNPKTNYAEMKFESEKALAKEVKRKPDIIAAILRVAPVYTKNFTDNLVAKITDPKSKSLFVYGSGTYGFQFCCVHNLVDFMLCFLSSAKDATYTGVYNISDKNIITASEIISFMREHHRLGVVLQRSAGKDSLASFVFRKIGVNQEFKTNYRYLDLQTITNNNMLDTTKATKIMTLKWNISNTK